MREGAIAIIERDEKFLTITRSETVVAPGKICFPGGGIEANETPEQALCRECIEELGITVRPLRLIDTFVTPWNVRLYCYTAEMESEAIVQPNKTEVASVQWLTLFEMLEHHDLLESNRPLLDKLLSRTVDSATQSPALELFTYPEANTVLAGEMLAKGEGNPKKTSTNRQ